MKSALIATVGKLGGYQFARALTRKQPKILMYHRFSVEKRDHDVTAVTFEKQLQLIKRYFKPMTLASLVRAIQVKGEAPNNSVVITVDDGYRDFYEVAFPLLKHYGVPATFFVTTGFINRRLWLWYDQVRWILAHKRPNVNVVTISGLTVSLEQSATKLWPLIVDHFLQISNSDRLLGMEQLIIACNLTLPKYPPEEYAAANWTELAEMQNNGIEIGGHTVTHPSLGRVSLEEARREIIQSKKDIDEALGSAQRTFCYPNGQPADYTSQVKNIVSEAGYLAAVTAFSDRHNVNIDNSWRRFTATEESFQFMKSLYGVEHIGNILKKIERSAI
jgi:peptidoglycan/xylan/chitin deacetylase (PgdA/CDA1 family)